MLKIQNKPHSTSTVYLGEYDGNLFEVHFKSINNKELGYMEFTDIEWIDVPPENKTSIETSIYLKFDKINGNQDRKQTEEHNSHIRRDSRGISF